MRILQLLSSAFFFFLVLACNRGMHPNTKVANRAVKQAKKNLDDLLKHDEYNSFYSCYEARKNSQDTKQAFAACKLIPIPALYLDTALHNANQQLQLDTNFFISLVYSNDSLISIIRSRGGEQGMFKIVSTGAIYNNDGTVNGYPSIVILELLAKGIRFYTVRYNQERYLIGYFNKGVLNLISFSYGHIKYYNSIDEWLKAKAKK